ncbi:hypothetical protein QUB41_12145 [Microcoleus sp. AT8-B2]|uniref:hypothetical protein n=1 Tax=unclassified Microcoleus TaxID=2642155 RepID=UPI002FD23061
MKHCALAQICKYFVDSYLDGYLLSMDSLSVEQYDSAEQEAISELPNVVIEAFQPVAFHQVGYPTRIRRESELVKYIEVLHYNRFEKDYSTLLEGLTEKEFSLLRHLTSLVSVFSESQFGRKVLARSSLLRMINILRHIKYIWGDARPRVFEIGPGNGYLGAMLMLEGYPYAATDISQAFYLYQNHLWNFISNSINNNLVEAVYPQKEQLFDNLLLPGNVIHIPWWEYVRLKDQKLPYFDIVTCNHALCEMQYRSLRFNLIIAKRMLREEYLSESLLFKAFPKAFVFEGSGAQLIHKLTNVINLFLSLGYVMLYNDEFITILVKGDNECLSNSVYQKIVEGRQHHQDSTKVNIDDVNSFYTELIGSEEHLSPDELFFKFVQGTE